MRSLHRLPSHTRGAPREGGDPDSDCHCRRRRVLSPPQGSLAGASFKPLEKEGAPAAGRGFACLIGNGPDFFLAVRS